MMIMIPRQKLDRTEQRETPRTLFSGSVHGGPESLSRALNAAPPTAFPPPIGANSGSSFTLEIQRQHAIQAARRRLEEAEAVDQLSTALSLSIARSRVVSSSATQNQRLTPLTFPSASLPGVTLSFLDTQPHTFLQDTGALQGAPAMMPPSLATSQSSWMARSPLFPLGHPSSLHATILPYAHQQLGSNVLPQGSNNVPLIDGFQAQHASELALVPLRRRLEATSAVSVQNLELLQHNRRSLASSRDPQRTLSSAALGEDAGSESKANNASEATSPTEGIPPAASMPVIARVPEERPESRVYISELQPLDILCGRGGRSNHHTGNKKFRQVVTDMKEHYRSIEAKTAKTDLSMQIVDYIRGYGGRFVKVEKRTNKMYLMSVVEARKKTSQALRETKQLKWIG